MERVKWIDYAKGIGILLIMMAHCFQYFSPMKGINGYICSFHVPIFFIVGGCLTSYKENARNFKKFIGKRAKMLLIPYVIFSILNSLLKFAVLFLQHALTSETIVSELKELFITGNGTVWFLLTLFLIELLFYFVKKKSKIIILIITIVGLILPYLVTIVPENAIRTVLLRVIAGLGYYSLGYLICPFLKQLKTSNLIIFCILFWLAGITSYAFLGSGYSFFDGRYTNMTGSLLCSICNGLGILFLLIFINKKEYRNKLLNILSFFGRNSLIIMLVHPTLLLLFTFPLGGYFVKMMGLSGIAAAIILWILLIVLNVPFIYIINNWFPWMIGKRKGNG